MKGDFFGRVAAVASPAHRPPFQEDKLKRLQCRAMWNGWRLLPLGEDAFAFVHMNNEGERHPNSGWFSLAEAERFIEMRERENSRW